MNTMPKYCRFILFILLSIVSIQLGAQVSSINNYLSKVNGEVSQINQLANNKQVYEAIAQLNETRRDLDRYVNYYLEDEMRKAKAENSGYAPTLNVSFSTVLTASYWEDRVKQAQKSIDLAESAFSERNYQRTLDSQDEVWSYLKAVYGVVKTIKDVIQNVEQAKFYDAITSAKEGVDGFIEDYKQIEEARLQIINTELYEINVRRLISKGKRMEETCWQFSSFMRAYEDDVNDFYQIANRLNQKINEISNETVIDLSGAEYSWNSQKYLNQINAAANQYKAGNGNYESTKSQIEAINEKAEADKDQVSQNLYNSGASTASDKANKLEVDFNEFYDLSFDVLDECYRISQRPTEPVNNDANSAFVFSGENENSAKQQTESAGVINSQSNFDGGQATGPLLTPGKRIPNKLYHSYWDIGGGRKMLLKQTGNSVEIEGGKTGTVSGGKLICKYKDKKGVERTDVYTLIEDGYKMEVKREWSDEMISNNLLIRNNFTAPSEQQIKEFRSKNGSYTTEVYVYNGGIMAMYGDSDGDQVADKCDICSNTEKGLSVGNGGVDIAGCPTGQNISSNTATTNVSSNNSQQPKTNISTPATTPATTSNAFAGAGSSTNQSNTTNKNTTPQIRTVSTTNPVSPPGLVGTATNDGNGKGTYCSLDLKTVKNTDIIVFNQLSGKLDKVEVIWRTSGGVWRTQYEGTRTNFKVSEFLNNIPDEITHFNFTVNSRHNESYTPNACVMEVWHLPAGGKIPPRQQMANSSSQAATSPANTKKAERIGWAVNKHPKNGSSSMGRIPVYKLQENDKLVFNCNSGVFQKFYVRWVGVNFSELLYEKTTDIVYSTADLLAKRPEKAMYIDFWVNQYSDVSCSMECWVFPQGVPIPAEWNIKDNSGSTVSNNGGNDFYELIKKADEAFNRKYWDESQGVRSSSNPKQESLDFLLKAEPLIKQQQDVNQRYSMILTLTSKYADYAKRVFVNTAKNDFIQRAGSLLSNYGSAANSLTDQKATAYNKIADGWRELTKAAMWGSHQYNKAACDTEAKKYYDLALREDRNNVQLQKTVEKINAPKKAVPAAVAATKPIPESSWAKAENLRNMIAENIPIQLDDQANPIEIGLMKVDMGSINTGSGNVWLQRSGTNDWQLLTKTDEYIFTGDKIKTGDDAKNVSFNYSADNTNLAILPGSIVTFEDGQLYIERGNVYVRVIKSGNEFLIITPKATTGCRGTEFTVDVDKSGITDVHLYEGVIEMRNSTAISYLVPGQTAKVEKDDDEINVVQFNIQQHKQQFLSNQNQSKTTNPSNPFQNVTGGGRIVGGQIIQIIKNH